MKKHFPTFIDATATGFDTIYVSAGVRGLQAEISPADLAAGARLFQDISTSPDNE